MRLTNNEKTFRGNGRWAKVTRIGQKYFVACGWEGRLKAERVTWWNSDKMTARVWAEITAKSWIDD